MMRKNIQLSLLALMGFFLANAQSGSFSVPENASFVLKINGSALDEKMNLSEIEQLPMMKEFFGSMDRGYSSFSELGVKLKSDIYIYGAATDSLNYFAAILPLSDMELFKTRFVQDMADAEEVGEYSYANGSELVSLSQNQALFMTGDLNSAYMRDRNLALQYGLVDEERGEPESTEYEIHDVLPEVEESPANFGDVLPEAPETVYDSEITVVEAAYEEEVFEVAEEYEVEEQEETPVPPMEDNYYERQSDPIRNYNPWDPYGNNLSYRQKKELKRIWFADIAQNLRSSMSPKRSADMMKVKSSKSDAFVFFDYGNLLESLNFGGDREAEMMMSVMKQQYGSPKVYGDLNFDKDAIRMKTVYKTDVKMTELTGKMMNAKFGNEFFKYFSADDMIGYYGFAVNTEGALEVYPQLMSDMVSGMMPDPSIGPAVSDLLSLAIDEKAIGKLIPGQGLVVFHNLGMEKVEFVSYDYDENWNKVEKVEYRDEMIPSFTVMLATDDKKNVNNILSLSKMSRVLQTTEYGYRIDDTKISPLPVYFHVKEDMLIVSNSKWRMDQMIAGTIKAGAGGEHKKNLKKNNMAFYFDAKKMASSLPEDMKRGEMGEMSDFAEQNLESISFTSRMAGSKASTGEIEWKIPGGEKNGWDYMVNLMNKMYELDKR